MTVVTTPSAQSSNQLDSLVLAVVGLGYVGLPLAIEFGKRFRTVGFDISAEKISSYARHVDETGEVPPESFRSSGGLRFTSDAADLRLADVVIVAVPTPVDAAKLPDFGPLKRACQTVGNNLKEGATVVFESTVYPGATEEICIRELELYSGKKWGADFFVGYSPERINPGDKNHSLRNVTKVVAGDCAATLDRLAKVYETVVDAGVHRASSIKVAEAAKVIENTQRDLNIALMNELAIIFHRMGIDTVEVLEAAGTKWNFLNFRPGLVGGHCIGVDPYYLTHAAQALGHHPEVILSGRRTNDGMGVYIARETVRFMVEHGVSLQDAKVSVLGLTFKENCADIRNSKVVDLINELQSFGVQVTVHDPRADLAEAKREYGVNIVEWEALPIADCLVLAVAHTEFVSMQRERFFKKVRAGGCVIDVKSALPRHDGNHGLNIWRL